MLHGADDPHPGPMIRDSLRPYLPQLTYVELPRCGHTPWLERHGSTALRDHLLGWIEATSARADLPKAPQPT